MPTKPKIVTITNTSEQVLNAIRNAASVDYKNYVPIATANAESIKAVGAVLMDYPALRNEFLNALVNRIAKVIVTSKMYDNPLAVFKRGFLEYGETVEEIFVDLLAPHEFSPETAEKEVFKREIPDVKAAFHVLNYTKFYKVTIEEQELRRAFLSVDGVTDLIAKITDKLYTSANYDEYIVTKYLLARNILDGFFTAVSIPDWQADKKNTVVAIKATANDFKFLKPKYNPAGVYTHTPTENMFVFLTAEFDAAMDVDVLSAAFNMEKADFIGNRMLVDSFAELDNDRLKLLFADDPNYREITAEESNALKTVPAILVDRDFFMFFDNLNEFTENYNGEGLYWNYFLHQWKTLSTSPFANRAIFIQGAPSINSVTVTPAQATAQAGQTIQFTAVVDSDFFANKSVNWTTDNVDYPITASGVLSIPTTAVKNTVVKVTATSNYDSTKKGESTLTIN